MKTSLAISICLLGLSMSVPAKEVSRPTSKEARSVQVQIFNAICPLSGEKIDPSGPTVEYKGKRIAFCCPGCIKTFKADPEKYLKNLSNDGQKWISPSPTGM